MNVGIYLPLYFENFFVYEFFKLIKTKIMLNIYRTIIFLNGFD